MSIPPAPKLFWRFAAVFLVVLVTVFCVWRSGFAVSAPVVISKQDAPKAATPVLAQAELAPAEKSLTPAANTPLVAAAKAPVDVEASVQRLSFATGWKTETKPAFAAFNQWANRYAAATPDARESMVAEGVSLATDRRTLLADLIKANPKEAIASAVPASIRQSLPAEVAKQLEERVSARGNISLVGVTGTPGQQPAAPTFRSATIGGKTYRAHACGRRDEQATKLDISIHGIAVDNSLALLDSPVRVLDPGEIVPDATLVSPSCPVSGQPVAAPQVASGFGPFNVGASTAVQVGDTVFPLCHLEHAVDLENQLMAAENAAGPYVGSLNADSLPGDVAFNGGSGSSNISRPPLSWCQGTKKVLILRVDFSDLPGAPMALDAAANMFNKTGGVSDFYDQCSFAKAAVQVAPYVSGTSADVTPVLRLPKTAAVYAAADDNNGIMSAAESAANALGYNVNSYDRIVCAFAWLGNLPNSQINYGGLGEIQGKHAWTNGSYDFRVLTHELGHTFGLYHANLWQVNDGNPLSSTGSSVEYADPYDAMGSTGGDMRYQFNHWEKSILQWIPDTAVQTIGTAGTYRVHRFDSSTADLGNTKLALKVVRNNNEDFWIAYRPAFSTNVNLTNGAYILYGYNSRKQSALIDTNTPNTSPTDAGLQVGQTLNDPASDTYLTTVGKGGTAANGYLDMAVNFGPFPGNQNPTAAVAIDRTAYVGLPVTLSANASDPDDDALAYFWDFGDGSPSVNVDSPSKTWTKAGTYSVKCVASDMKGGTATSTLSVVVSAPPSSPVITGALTATATQDVAFSYKIQATNTPTSYNALGLPTGLGVNTATGLISGSASVSGVFNVGLRAANISGTGSATLVLTVNPPAPVIAAATAIGVRGQPFDYQIEATNNPDGYGAAGLPPGLTIDIATGVIFGTPTVVGTFNVSVTASNLTGTGTGSLQIVINPSAPVIVSGLSVNAVRNKLFSYQIIASNGPTSYDASGLPGGFAVDKSSGVISGIPVATGTSSVVISAANVTGTGSALLTITVYPPPPVISNVLGVTGTVGQFLSYQIVASDATNYNATGLPAGLSVEPSKGLITGIPTQPLSAPVTLIASNGGGSGTASVMFEIKPNIFVPGTYNGLIRSTPDTYQGSGFVSLRVLADGSLTGYAIVSGASYPFKGRFDDSANFVATLPRRNLVPMSLTLHYSDSGVTGGTGDGSFSSAVFAAPTLRADALHPAPQAGKYTLRISSSDYNAPAGHGVATLTIDAYGVIKATGWLADGTPFSQTASLTADGSWPLFALTPNQGVIFGNATFSNLKPVTFGGPLVWLKTIPSSAFVINIPMTVAGSAYTPPARNTRVLPLAETPSITFSRGELSPPLTRQLAISLANAVRATPAGSVSMQLAPLTGAFTGYFLHPVSLKQTIFHGVVDQLNNRGDGFFLGPKTGGDVSLDAALKK